MIGFWRAWIEKVFLCQSKRNNMKFASTLLTRTLVFFSVDLWPTHFALHGLSIEKEKLGTSSIAKKHIIFEWTLNNLQLTSATKNHVGGVKSFPCYRPIWSELHSQFPTTWCDSKGHHVAAISIKDVFWSQVLWPRGRLVAHVRDFDVIIR